MHKEEPFTKCPRAICLGCGGSLSGDRQNEIRCGFCGALYPVVKGTPVLLSPRNQVFRPEAYTCDSVGAERWKWRRAVARLGTMLPRISTNMSSERCLKKFAALLQDVPSATILVVGGGKQKRWLDAKFSERSNIHLVYTDVDGDALVDYICDAHDLPFENEAFDGIITTAVIQHVMYPERAASEILRVLKRGGLVYSEMAFMQQVIEGAYDFTRYTLSGHRRLFNQLDELESGLVAGPGTALVWAVENFMLSFVESRAVRVVVKALARALFFWIKYADYITRNKPGAIDGASCTYFFGQKNGRGASDIDIIRRYSGAKFMEHV
jgi:SAM-dependent methyltransferase